MSTLEIRDKLKEDLSGRRKLQRESQKDKRRCGLGLVSKEVEVQISGDEVLKLCNRIKRRKQADQLDLYRLSNAFLNSLDNIKAFMMNEGAINVLINALTGSHGEKQVLAAESICNLSLGDHICCAKIAKLTGSYLITLSTSSNKELARTTLWTLYNLTAEGTKALAIILGQKFYLKLLSILEGNYDQGMKSDATRCLCVLLGDEKYDGFESLNHLIELVLSSWNDESPRLLFEISRRREFSDSKDIHRAIFRKIIHYLSEQDKPQLIQQLYCIRIMGNLASQQLDPILEDKEIFFKTLNSLLLNEDPVFGETIRCIRSFVQNLPGSTVHREAFTEELVNRLNVPRRPEMKNYVQEDPERMESD